MTRIPHAPRSPWEPPPSAVEAARARIGAPARATVAEAETLADRAEALLASPSRLREVSRSLATALVHAQTEARLRERPLSDLRAAAGRGLRLGPLENAGMTTVADVLRTPERALLGVAGVGPHTAAQVAAAARRIAEQVFRDTRVRLDPRRRSPDQTRLLAALAATREADQAVASLGDGLRALLERLRPLINQAKHAASRWRMLFSRRATRHAALVCLLHLDGVLADPRVLALREALDEAERRTDPRSHEHAAQRLWRRYETDAASFNALLATLGGAVAPTGEAAHGFVSPRLRREVTEVRLDTRLLRPSLTLRGYQAFGARYALRQRRCILGDEMGLGKTVQALAALAHLAAEGHRHFLVVCPTSVQINWLNETGRHTLLPTYSLHGGDRESEGRDWLRDGGVAVTTFGTLGTLDCVRRSGIAMLVVDEAHFVKNPGTRRSRNVRAVADRTPRVLFLTGTPLENRVEEFRSLVGQLTPDLGRIAGPTDALAGAGAFRRAVAPVYLRRNQEDVLTELPGRIETRDWVRPTARDADEYHRAVMERNFMRMRRAAFASPDSAKLQRLCEILEEAFDDRRKVVVFSYFRDVLRSVRQRLAAEYAPPATAGRHRPRVMGPLTGSVPARDRQRLVDEFAGHRGPAVLLSQIEAGGVGLNIQAASVVVLAEPQVKPAIEEQAVARVLRMGQVRTVRVHRLLSKGSVDERVLELQEHKRLLFDAFARRSDAKDADRRAVDTGEYRPPLLDDPAVPLERRIVMAELHRLGV